MIIFVESKVALFPTPGGDSSQDSGRVSQGDAAFSLVLALPPMLAFVLIPFLLLAGTASAEIRGVEVAPADCRILERHRPDEDVEAGAAYRPGVDLAGRPVAPADLGGGRRPVVPPVVELGLAVEPLRGGRDPFGTAGSSIPVGRVGIDTRTGEATLDGRPLGPADREAMAVACRRARAR
jgi:hypothetical protein